MYLHFPYKAVSTKKALSFSLGFLFLWFTADRTISFLLEKVLLDANFRFSKIYNRNARAEVLILGNSRGVNGFFAPKIEENTGLKTLNLSYNGLSITTARLLLEDYLELNVPPKILILEVTNLGTVGLNENILQLYSGFSARLSESWEKSNPQFALAQKYFAKTNQFNGELFMRTLYYFNKTDQNWINRYKISDAYARNYVARNQVQDLTTINKSAKDELARISSICLNHGVRLVPVITPIAPILFKEIKHYDEWVIEIETLFTQPVIDLGRELEELKYFADALHMNLYGFNELYPILKKMIFGEESKKLKIARPKI
jgi:hypothetical protein